MNEDEQGLPLAEWEQQQESERQAWERHASSLEELRQINREMKDGAE